MRLIRVNYHDGGIDRSNLAGFNNVGAAATVGVKVADLLDSNGDNTGVSLLQSVSLTATGAVVQADSAPNAEFPLEFYRSHFYPPSNSNVELCKLTGLPPGSVYTLRIAGNHGGTTQTSFTATGGTPSPAVYSNAGQKDPVPGPVEITGAIPENGEISITFGATGFARANGFSIEYAEATGPSIPTADNITTEGQTATFTLSGNTEAPTTVQINGEAGSNITFVSEDTEAGTETYSYTAPLLLDDDTATLAVTVDGETVTTTISYANSYDRDQLTHPATEAEYNANSLSYPNAYGTSLPYEWKVITDASSAVVVIDWDALEADDGFFKDIANYATPVANGSTTVTLGVFVPETGESYQFDRTINVSDGSVVVTEQGLWRELFRDPTEELFIELFR